MVKSNAIVFQKLLGKLCTNTLNAAGAAEVTCTEHTHALSPRKTLRATSYFAAVHTSKVVYLTWVGRSILKRYANKERKCTTSLTNQT